MTTTVREFRPDDVPALARLRRQWTEENAGALIDDPSYDERFASGSPARTARAGSPSATAGSSAW